MLSRAQKVSPQAPEVAELRQEIERAADGREQEQIWQRRSPPRWPTLREAIKTGGYDAAARAITEALGHNPNDPDALALKARSTRPRRWAAGHPGAAPAPASHGQPARRRSAARPRRPRQHRTR